jgi:hypothetical protein
MKKFLPIFIICTFILVSLSGQEITLKPYGIKSGIIEYTYSGDKTGKGTLYFDDYGLKTAMYMDAVEDGEKQNGLVVTFGDYQYMWDPDNPAEGMKLKNPLISWMSEASNGDIESFSESMFSKMGFKKAPDETFLGKPCRVMKGEMGKVLTWNGILMMLDMKVMTSGSHQEATNIQTNIPVDPKHFIVPKIEFAELPVF